MRKKYSDPLMFSSVLLTSLPIQHSGEPSPIDDWDSVSPGPTSKGLRLNSSPASEEPAVSIENPVEQAVTAPEIIQEEAPAAEPDPAPAAPLEVEPVIDTIVPEETLEPAQAGE